MSKSKSAEPMALTPFGFLRNKIATVIGFHERTLPGMTWKSIVQLLWLKTQIAVGDLRRFLVGSKTDDHLCGERCMYLGDKIRDHKAKVDLTRDQEMWLEELVELSVDREMAWFEMHYHRDGKQKYSWSREDMSEESIAELPDWWFDGTRAKRKLREINGKSK